MERPHSQIVHAAAGKAGPQVDKAFDAFTEAWRESRIKREAVR